MNLYELVQWYFKCKMDKVTEEWIKFPSKKIHNL